MDKIHYTTFISGEHWAIKLTETGFNILLKNVFWPHSAVGGTLDPSPGNQPVATALEDRVLTSGLPGIPKR